MTRLTKSRASVSSNVIRFGMHRENSLSLLERMEAALREMQSVQNPRLFQC
jgi:hypothetical protein